MTGRPLSGIASRRCCARRPSASGAVTAPPDGYRRRAAGDKQLIISVEPGCSCMRSIAALPGGSRTPVQKQRGSRSACLPNPRVEAEAGASVKASDAPVMRRLRSPGIDLSNSSSPFRRSPGRPRAADLAGRLRPVEPRSLKCRQWPSAGDAQVRPASKPAGRGSRAWQDPRSSAGTSPAAVVSGWPNSACRRESRQKYGALFCTSGLMGQPHRTACPSPREFTAVPGARCVS